MERSKLVAPVVKWVGGKRQLLNVIMPMLPKHITTYCEPFFGGGAVLFSLQPSKAIINDLNNDLITMYEVIKKDVDSLIDSLAKHENNAEYFYALRDLDRNKETYKTLSDLEKASRLIYLNKTCYNGLFRVNSAGEFNTPFGYYKNPNIVNAPTLRAVSKYFNTAKIEFRCEDFEETLSRVSKGAFVYLDPPYDPVSDTASFTGYNKGGFGREEQLRLYECCERLNKKNIKFMLSNSSTDFIKALYGKYNVTTVQASRAINSNGLKRGAVEEVLVTNYGKE